MNPSSSAVSGANEEFYSPGTALSCTFVRRGSQETPMTTPRAIRQTAGELARGDYALEDNLWADRGQVFLSGNQALVRLLLMQRAADAARGLDTRGFVSGYRGSP